MAAFACLAFISQAFAVVDYRCIGMEGHTDRSLSHAGQQAMHGQHRIHSQTDADTVHDCCKHHQCSMVDCISAHSAGAAAVATPAPLTLAVANTLPVEGTTAAPMAYASPLFRPPISR